MIPVIAHAENLIKQHDMIISDVWGVIHNGMRAWESAYTCLSKAKALGLPVVLVTNAPRPSPVIISQLDRLGVPRHSYDAILSSGDLTRALIAERAGKTCYHIGPERDLGLFEGLNTPLVDLEFANYVVCSGLFDDENETVSDYQLTLDFMLKHKLTFICANPDKIVERGTKVILCAGAIADRYQEMGGEVIFAGKPYAPIYEAAKAKGEVLLGQKINTSKILCIGDALRTDIKGANDFGASSLFTIEGIHGHEVKHSGVVNQAALDKLFQEKNATADAAMSFLNW